MFSPAEVAKNYVTIGKNKANLPIAKMFVLGILAGMFIGLAGVGASTAAVTIEGASVGKFVGACIFPAGLAMVLIAGSELFTGNCLLVIPLMEKEITVGKMLTNWVVVWCGNLVGGTLVSALCVGGHQLSLFSSQLAVADLSTAAAKCSLSFSDALIKGILCNFLVCIAVWMAFAAKDVAGKIVGLFFPVMLFVLEGYEHSVANMYYITVGLFAKGNASYAAAAAEAGVDLSKLTVGNMFFANLLPVTLGNIIGGSVFVGLAYWFVYLRKK